jgi:hypothetical protein
MSIFGGTSSFGSSVFGGDPAAFLYAQIDAETTTEARRLTARGLYDGTNIMAIEFGVGSDGFDPYNYSAALPVNPDATSLDDPVFTSTIDHVEHTNKNGVSYYCLLDTSEANVTLGEVCIWSVVRNSPGDPVSGTKFISAIGHFPILCKNSTMPIVIRVTVQK